MTEIEKTKEFKTVVRVVDMVSLGSQPYLCHGPGISMNGIKVEEAEVSQRNLKGT